MRFLNNPGIYARVIEGVKGLGFSQRDSVGKPKV